MVQKKKNRKEKVSILLLLVRLRCSGATARDGVGVPQQQPVTM